MPRPSKSEAAPEISAWRLKAADEWLAAYHALQAVYPATPREVLIAMTDHAVKKYA